MHDNLSGLIQGKSTFSLNITNSLPWNPWLFIWPHQTSFHGPQLVITENMEKADLFMENYSFWTIIKAHLLPFYNPNAFAGVQISHPQVQDRLSWFFHALNGHKTHVSVAPILGLLQKTLSPDILWITALNIPKEALYLGDFLKIFTNWAIWQAPWWRILVISPTGGAWWTCFPPKWNFRFAWNCLAMILKACEFLILSAREQFQKLSA